MDKSIFKYVLKNSKRDQIVLLAFTVVSFPFLYFSLDLPKTIINKAVSGTNFPHELSLFGIDTDLLLDQLPYLWTLCGLYLALVCINGGFKYYINVLTGTLSERMLRRIRYQLIERVLRFPLPHFRGVSSGSLVSMIAAETEPLGGFAGEAFSLPAFQGGTLLTLLAFMFIQDPVLGLAAIALYPMQGYIIPKLQRRVNLLGKERVRHVRQLSEGLGEMVSSIGDIHAHGTAQYELAHFSDRLGDIYHTRYDIYRKKFFIKFLNNFLGQLTPFFFFAIGGYLVIEGDLTLGALVAVLAAYKDLSAPWKELLGFYQRLEDARIKYEQLVEQFHPPGLIDEALIAPSEERPAFDGAKVSLANVSLEEEQGSKVISGVTFSVGLDEHIGLAGPDGGGRSEVARILARQLVPTGGHVMVGDRDLMRMPELLAGRAFAYVDDESYIRFGSVRENLLYGLNHLPLRSGGDDNGDAARRARLHEAMLSGNSNFDVGDDWIDYDAIGVRDRAQLTGRAVETLRAVRLEDDVFQIGLKRVIDPRAHPDLANGILDARKRIRQRLAGDSELAGLVEVFEINAFNENASIAENILFGTPLDGTFDIENLGRNDFVVETLTKVGLIDQFPELGRAIAALMVELFRDLPPGHEFFERFSFIQADDLGEYQRILNQASQGRLDQLSSHDRAMLIDLPFKLVPARHRLGLISDDLAKRLLAARKVFAETLPDSMRGSIAFFDTERYNGAMSLQDNILFGKIATHKAESASRIGDLLSQVVDEIGLRDSILDVGLDFDVGIGGKRLTSAQRQKLAIARCLIKRPNLLIVNEATQGLNAQAQEEVYKGVRDFMEGRGLVWVQGEMNGIHHFSRIVAVERGRAHEQGGGAAPEQEPPAGNAAGSDAEPATAGLALQTDVLAGIPFFAGLDRSQLKLLAFTSELVDFTAGQDLLRQGDHGDNAYVILDGSLDIIVDTARGPTTVAQVGRGALIGELALLCDTPRTATVRASGPVSALNISKDVFFQLVQENAGVALNLTRMVANRLAKAMHDLSAKN